ncbi:DUF930 domain-containing protein [Chelatococcus reniformis]|nr:DUF930 domain-containing protein [Chelatococcus reniformis]
MAVLAMGVTLLGVAQAAAESHLDHVLKRLEPDSRFNQVCDMAAMAAIGKSEAGLRPDRAMLDAAGPVKRVGDTATGEGAVIRSKGHWYGLSFVCETTPDRMRVRSFDYKLLGEIPQSKWEELGLWR